jgi:hypothetical protein
MIERIVETRAGSWPHVIRIHSSAIAPALSPGSQASRPKAYQLACAKSWPLQLTSRPVFATPAMPVRRVPPITFATWDPAPFAYVSASRNSFHIGAR